MACRPGPSRSHTEAFLFMRGAASQRRRFASAQDEWSDDRVSLLRAEEGEGGAPPWVPRVEGLNYMMTRIEGKVAELASLHLHHLSRPGMEEGGEEEKIIQRLTGDATTLFGAAQKQVVEVQSMAKRVRGRERVVVTNIVTALVVRLQELTERFRSSQGGYLRRMEAREERSSQYFATFQGEDDGLLVEAAWSQQDVLLMEDQGRVLRRREEEISNVVRSIQDLNTIFKELATMVAEQGEVVDRIEVSIEAAGAKVEDGLEQLKQAAKHQKSNRKMQCILCLGPSLVLLILVLVWVKS